MTLLAGREWFSWQVVDLVGEAAKKAMSKYQALLDFESDATTAIWRDAALTLSYLKAELNRLADADSAASDPPVYREGSPLFDRVEKALEPLAGDSSIVAAAAALPANTAAVTPRTANTLLWGVGLLAVLVLGYQVARK